MSRSPAKFRVSLTSGDRILTEGVIDKNAIHVFKHGYCSELAYALHQRIGGALIQIEAVWPDGSFVDDGPSMHAGVVLGEAVDRLVKATERQALEPTALGDAVVLDIEGRHYYLDWIYRWLVPGAGVCFSAAIDVDEDSLGRLEHCRAHTFVDPLLKQCGVALP